METGPPSRRQRWSKASKMSLRFASNLPPGNQKGKHPCIQASKPRVPEVGGRGGSLFNIYIYTYIYIYIYICIYPPAPLAATKLRRGVCKSQVTVQCYCYRSAVPCPLQVYGSQSSSYWYLFTSFQVLGSCLIATGTAQNPIF